MAVVEAITKRKEREVKKNADAHPLDNPGLNLRQRVYLQHQTIKRVKEAALTQTEPALTNFPNDLIGGEIYMRTDLNEPGEAVATAVGVTQSSSEGLTATNHSMSYQPPDSKQTLAMSQEERRKEFLEVVLPNIERVVFLVPGFESTRNVFEVPINQKVLNPATPRDSDPKKLLKDGKTLVVSLSVMGSEHNADIQKKEKITPFAVVGQIYEAMDRIGLQVMKQKTKRIQTQEWSEEKNQLSANLDMAMAQKNKPMIRAITTKLGGMIRDEQEIINGTYWHNRIAAVIGHSMGAWFVTQMLLMNFYQGYSGFDEVAKYWSNIGAGAFEEQRLMQETAEAQLSKNDNRGLDMFYNMHKNMNSKVANPFDPNARNFQNLLSKAAFYGIAPVEAGTKVYDQLVKEARSNGDHVDHHVKFMREKKTVLMNAMKYFAVHGMLGLRNLSLTVGDPVNFLITQEFVGANAMGALEIIFNHMFTFKDDPNFHVIGSNVIDNMRKIIGQNTMRQLDGFEILNRFHIYVPKKDQTLRMEPVTKWLMELVVNLISSSDLLNPLSGYKADDLISMFSTEVEESPHYMTEEGWEMLVDRASEWVHDFQYARYSDSFVGPITSRLAN